MAPLRERPKRRNIETKTRFSISSSDKPLSLSRFAEIVGSNESAIRRLIENGLIYAKADERYSSLYPVHSYSYETLRRAFVIMLRKEKYNYKDEQENIDELKKKDESERLFYLGGVVSIQELQACRQDPRWKIFIEKARKSGFQITEVDDI